MHATFFFGLLLSQLTPTDSHIPLTKIYGPSFFPLHFLLLTAAKPAVGDSHLRDDMADADLDLESSPLNFTLTLDNTPVDMQGSLTSFGIGRDHELVLTATGGTFKGLLIRLGPQPDVSEFVIDYTQSLSVTADDPNYKIQTEHCVAEQVGGKIFPDGALQTCFRRTLAGIALFYCPFNFLKILTPLAVHCCSGVTHKSNDPKSRAAVTLRMDEPAPDMIMDITVVIQNNADGSEFYHSIFSFEAVDPENPNPTPTESAAIPNNNHRLLSGVAALILSFFMISYM